MKNLLSLFACILISYSGFSQVSTKQEDPVYLRFPAIPQFTVYKAPGKTPFTRENLKKKVPTIFFIFSPECGHCQNETIALTKNIQKFRNTQIVMVTHLPYEEMIEFYRKYNIAHYPQITMAWDSKFFFPVFFKVRNFPFIFVYDKKGNFKKSFEGDVKIEDITAAL